MEDSEMHKLGMKTLEDIVVEMGKITSNKWSDYIKKAQELGLIPTPEHPIDEFDRRTAAGYKLNLVTGEYYLNR